MDNQEVITDANIAARKTYELILRIEDTKLAQELTAVVTDAFMAKYKKGLDDGYEIGNKS